MKEFSILGKFQMKQTRFIYLNIKKETKTVFMTSDVLKTTEGQLFNKNIIIVVFLGFYYDFRELNGNFITLLT